MNTVSSRRRTGGRGRSLLGYGCFTSAVMMMREELLFNMSSMLQLIQSGAKINFCKGDLRDAGKSQLRFDHLPLGPLQGQVFPSHREKSYPDFTEDIISLSVLSPLRQLSFPLMLLAASPTFVHKLLFLCGIKVKTKS